MPSVLIKVQAGGPTQRLDAREDLCTRARPWLLHHYSHGLVAEANAKDIQYSFRSGFSIQVAQNSDPRVVLPPVGLQ